MKITKDKKCFITTPIYYINSVPHIGHAYTTIVADVLARYYREKNGKKNTFFLTGTDEHGAKIAEASENAKKTPLEFADALVPKFQKTWSNLGVEYDYFIRTTNPEHEKFVQDFILNIKKNNYIEKRKYEGLYCISCEKFVTKDDLIDGCCPDHPGKKPVHHAEENWFFTLSKFREPLLDAIESGAYQILPESRKNEVVSKIRSGLEDVSISRSGVKWGIQVPWDNTQTIYVWFDALLNYMSALKINNMEDFWPANIQLMAKDILWFHAVIWPAMLMAGGKELPKCIFAHGFFTINGQKMSKTIGNVIDPNIWVEKYGSDAVRYYLLTAFPFGDDGDVSEDELARKYNGDLANELGNLVNRVISMIKRYDINLDINKDCTNQKNQISSLVEKFKFDEALREIWIMVKDGNNFIEKNKPWEIAKTDPEKLTRLFNELVENLVCIAFYLKPFLPVTSAKILSQIKSLNPEPIFPKIQ